MEARAVLLDAAMHLSGATLWLEQKCSRMADQMERSFRRDLAEAALLQHWNDWNTTRLIFADWLEHRGGDWDIREASACRAEWRCDWKTETKYEGHIPYVFTFRVPALFWSKIAIGRHNADWLLGFPPGSLRHLADAVDSKEVRFSWCLLRDATCKRSELGKGDRHRKHPLGFLAYWWREPGTEPSESPGAFFFFAGGAS